MCAEQTPYSFWHGFVHILLCELPITTETCCANCCQAKPDPAWPTVPGLSDERSPCFPLALEREGCLQFTSSGPPHVDRPPSNCHHMKDADAHPTELTVKWNIYFQYLKTYILSSAVVGEHRLLKHLIATGVLAHQLGRLSNVGRFPFLLATV